MSSLTVLHKWTILKSIVRILPLLERPLSTASVPMADQDPFRSSVETPSGEDGGLRDQRMTTPPDDMNSKKETTPPGDRGTTPPVDSEKTTPPGDSEKTTPPSDRGTTPPVDSEKVTTPPSDRGTTPPSDREKEKMITPPADRETTPPIDSKSDHSVEEERQPQGKGRGVFRYFPFNLMRSFSTNPSRDYKYWKDLPLDKKRQEYSCGTDYVTLDQIQTWQEVSGFAQDPASLTAKLSLWRGDITKLEIDAIVNAANSSLMGGGGVDGAIHRAASRSLLDECRALDGCAPGDTKLTHGHRLPAKYILHTVGPMNQSERTLTSCYKSCLQLVKKHHLRSVAFSCVATGIYGYPNEAAAHVALATVKDWLEEHSDQVDRIIFCVFLKIDDSIYRELIPLYFPSEKDRGNSPPPSHTPSGDSPPPSHAPSGDGPPPLTRSQTAPERAHGSLMTSGPGQQEVGESQQKDTDQEIGGVRHTPPGEGNQLEPAGESVAMETDEAETNEGLQESKRPRTDQDH